MKIKKIAAAVGLTLMLSTASHANVLPQSQTGSSWYTNAQTTLTAKTAQAQNENTTKAKNVILFVGDGMGISTLTAARILQGQRAGELGEEGYLSFEEFPYSAQVKTYNVDAQTPDSAGTMTAMISGVKTDVGVIGVDEDIERGVCSTVAGNELLTATELAEIKGLATGIVSTARITHATPAATYAKSADRNWEDISDMPETETACEDIASQLVNFEKNLEARFVGTDVDGLDVVMGGGRRHFLPKDAAANSADAVSEVEGDRTDERNLVTEWQTQYPQGTYVMDQAGFDAIADDATKVFGLFNESHMQYEADRANDIAGEPSLSEMTSKAIDVLGKNENGFFLTVESGRIDHAHHAGNAYNALNDTIEFAKAVQAAVDNTNPEETLILVTADHSHVFTIAGYPKRGNPILGQVVAVGETTPSLAADDMPYTTVGYANGLGFRNLVDETDADAAYLTAPVAGRVELTGVDTTTPGFHQEATVPLGSETHAGEDISLHAKGPGAQLAQGVIEQNVVFHLIDQALELTQQ
ncbi:MULTISPECIES: alkaline phosphatase [Pseudoalteromonas]|uniref:Alkaline phosphatase n=1 Tax=Pseudoalteromonas undina TaxID=43660 RepID=A0ACC6R4A8_9GAMM|nr:alkaline phosphatase [Pseudoalteromonas sp. P1-25]KPZ55401.1 Alkaline phosphatase 3 precursor [Pseudoalteromonas sp. P1-25]